MDDVQDRARLGWGPARSTIRLVGSVKSEDLSEIALQLEICGPGAGLHLEAGTVVGVTAGHFPGRAERQGTELAGLPASVRERLSRARRRHECACEGRSAA